LNGKLQLLDYLWEGERLVGIQFSTYTGYFVFRPTSPASFASYDTRSRQSVRLVFKPEHGITKSLILADGLQALTAVREP
jgi:hypothetical protein